MFAEDPMLLVSAHNNVGIALKAQKKYPEAAAELRKSLAIAREAKSLFLQAHVLGNLASAELTLTDEETTALDRASELPVTDYPYGEMGVEQRSRRLSGGR